MCRCHWGGCCQQVKRKKWGGGVQNANIQVVTVLWRVWPLVISHLDLQGGNVDLQPATISLVSQVFVVPSSLRSAFLEPLVPPVPHYPLIQSKSFSGTLIRAYLGPCVCMCMHMRDMYVYTCVRVLPQKPLSAFSNTYIHSHTHTHILTYTHTHITHRLGLKGTPPPPKQTQGLVPSSVPRWFIPGLGPSGTGGHQGVLCVLGTMWGWSLDKPTLPASRPCSQ